MFRSSSRVVVLVACLLPACGNAENAPASDEPISAAPESLNVDGVAIANLEAAWNAAWTAKNAVTFASLYTEDARFIGPSGGTLAGRAAIEAQHTFLFGGPFAASTQATTIVNMNFLTNRIAVVDLNGSLTGFASLPSGIHPTEPGLLRTAVRWVVVEQHDTVGERGHARATWKIAAQQITPIPPPPAVPPAP